MEKARVPGTKPEVKLDRQPLAMQKSLSVVRASPNPWYLSEQHSADIKGTDSHFLLGPGAEFPRIRRLYAPR